MAGPVRVAYDLRYAADHFTGIGTHAFALLGAMLELPDDDEFHVLWDPGLRHRRYQVRAFAAHPRVVWHERRGWPLRPWAGWLTGAWLRQVRPDVYLSPFYLMPQGARCPSVLTLHDVWPLRLPDRLSGWRRLAIRHGLAQLRRARRVVTSSDFSRREILATLGLDPDRVVPIPLGVPPRVGNVPPRPPRHAPEGPFALVVGDNRPRKNLELLARVWADLGDPPPLLLVSAGPEDRRYASLARLASRAGARGMRSVGWVEEAQLEWLYSHARLVLHPSRYEGFGFPLVESLARGVPALSSDIPTAREVAAGAAEFLDPDDAPAWASAIRRLAASDAERDRRALAARERARHLDYRITAARTRELLRQAAAEGP